MKGLDVIYFNNNQDVIEYFENVIEKCWTWERLTEEEKYNFLNLPVWDCIKGTREQRHKVFYSIYHAYLVGVGCVNDVNWRG